MDRRRLALTHTHPFIVSLLEALGVDRSRARRITLDIPIDDAVIVTVEQYVMEPADGYAGVSTDRFELVPADLANSESEKPSIFHGWPYS